MPSARSTCHNPGVEDGAERHAQARPRQGMKKRTVSQGKLVQVRGYHLLIISVSTLCESSSRSYFPSPCS